MGLVSMLIIPILFSSCPTRAEGEKELIKTDVSMTQWFNVEVRNEWNGNGFARAGQAGWLVWNEEDRIWELAPPASGGDSGHNSWNTTDAYYGVRLFSNDRNLPLKKFMDMSEYDGVTFKYRTNIMDTEARFRDCMYWWGYSNDSKDTTSPYYFGPWNYEGGFDDPCPDLGWREVIIPFHKLVKWGIPQNVTEPCNDVRRFNPHIWTHFRCDGRSPADGVLHQQQYWIDIVEFAFFQYQ